MNSINDDSSGGNDGSSGGGGGQDIIFPFSPGDKGGQVHLGGSKNSLARYLAKAGVEVRIATKVSAFSASLFANMDVEGINAFAREESVDRAILRAAQSSLKAELLRVENEKGRNKSRILFENAEEEDEEGEDYGIDCLARVASEAVVDELRRKAAMSREQPLSRAVNVYEDPYMVTARNEGKQHIINIYSAHLSDGTVHHRRMASLMYEEAPERGSVTIKIPQLNLCLISGKRTDVVSRSIVISTVLLMMEPSRLGALFKGNWEFDMKNFREVAYEH
jgi:hypothetical protein